MHRVVISLCVPLLACDGEILGGGSLLPHSTPATSVDGKPLATHIAPLPARRSTRWELGRALTDLLGVDTTAAVALLPPDGANFKNAQNVINPFDNAVETQASSAALIEGLRAAGSELADAVPTETLRALAGCPATGTAAMSCDMAFITRAGRRLLRRSLSGDEVSELVPLFTLARSEATWEDGARWTLRALLLHPESLFRVEASDTAPLDAYQRASRLSYFLWASAPDDALLDAAEEGRLDTDEGVRSAAWRLASDPRAHQTLSRFHAQWLGLESAPLPAGTLGTAMQAETQALLERALWSGDWTQLFTSTETFASGELAAHYGFPNVQANEPAQWRALPAGSKRAGLFGEGAFLSAAPGVKDTSVTRRGLLVRVRVLCGVVAPPPPGVNVDAAVNGSTTTCRSDAQRAHTVGGCGACHQNFDPIGTGLDQFDITGAFRTTEAVNTSCSISGDGKLAGVSDGAFNGPAELGAKVVENGLAEACLTRQLFRFAAGHTESGTDDETVVATLADAYQRSQHQFSNLAVETAVLLGRR